MRTLQDFMQGSVALKMRGKRIDIIFLDALFAELNRLGFTWSDGSPVDIHVSSLQIADALQDTWSLIFNENGTLYINSNALLLEKGIDVIFIDELKVSTEEDTLSISLSEE